MKIYVAIDDTDSLEEGATGQSAIMLMEMIEKNNWGQCESLTRHQLLLHPDIKYTSHNSSMCFTAEIDPVYFERFRSEAGYFLEKSSAAGSDPGLCLAAVEKLISISELIQFGYDAKERIVTKEEAYKLAARTGVHLSEHGGEGIGIIGALAGVGLRLTNNDGRFQGKMKIGNPGEIINAGNIKENSPIEILQSLDGIILRDDEKVLVGNKIKTVLLNGKRTLLVFKENEEINWKTCTNQHLKDY